MAKVTVSLPRRLLVFADRLAKEHSTSRSGVIAELLEKEEAERLNALMAEGYLEMAEENLREAEEALNLTREVVLRDG
ncbi:MAG: CopG family transcriptional regulator [SAR202 cluster bacterium]|nr:CopG family transcriptional regulator [SAR202 cluster bacterium]